MEFFNKARTVRLKSHHDKYLVADDDEVTVRQQRNGSSRKARWTVEFVDDNSHFIRLKSCYGGYLSASDENSNFGITGKKVLLLSVSDPKKIRIDSSVQWEPIKEGFKVKLRTNGGKFLRGNGATPPFRNSVTHDFPHRTSTQDWVLWEVDVLDIYVLDDQTLENCESPSSSFSPDEDHNFAADSENCCSPSYGALITGSPPPSVISSDSPRWPSVQSNRSRFSSSRQVKILNSQN